MTSALHRD